MLRVPNLFQQTLRSSSRLFTHLKHTDGIQPPARVGIVNHQQHRGIKTHSNFSQQHFLARVAQTQPNPSSTSKFFSSEAVAEAEAEGPVPTNTGRKKVSYDDRIDSSFVFSGNDSYHNPLEKYEVAAELFASQADYEKVLAICKKLRQPTFRVLNALLKAYIRAGLMGKVPEVFEQLRRFPAEDGGAIGSSYSALLELYVGYGFLREARNVLYKMCEDKMPPASNAMGELIDLHFERGNVDEALYYVQYLESLKLINHTVYDSFLNNLWQMCEDEYFYNFLKKFVVHIQKSIDRKIPVDYYEYLARGAALARKPKDAFVFHEYLLDHTSNIEPIVTEEVLQCMLDNLKGRTPWLRRTLFRSALRGIRVTGETWNQCLAYFFETGDYSSVIYAYQVMKRDLFLVAPSAQYVIFQAAVAVGTPESLGLIPELLTESSMDISLREQALQTLIDIQLNADHPLEVGEVLDKIYEILIQPGAPRNSTKFYALLIDYQLSRNQPTNAKTLLTSTIEKLTLESVSVQSLNLARRGIDIQVPEDEAPKQAISLQNLTEEQLAQLDPEGLATYTALILSGEPLPTWEEIFAPPPETILNPNNQDPDDFLATTQDSAARYAEDGQEHLDPVFHTGFERATEQLQSRTGDMLILPEDHEFHGNRVFSYAQYLPQVERILNTDEDALFSMISYSNQTAVGDKPVESWSDDEPIEPVLAPEPHYPDSDALEETLYKLKTYRTDDEDESADLALDSPDPVDSTSVVDVDADGLDSGSDGAEGSVGIDLNFVANPNYADYAEDDSSLDEAGEPLPEELRWQEPQDSALDDARNSDLLSDESDAVELVSDESDGLQESEGELEADDPASEREGELELEDDAETDTDDVEGGSVVYQSVFPTHHRRMRNFIKAHLAENNLIVENVQAREELLAYRDMLENNEALGRKEFLQVSGMWSSVVVYLLANSSADSASKLVQDVLEQVPMATPPSMTVLNLIAKAYVDQNASDRAERMFETLSVRPNRNTLSLLLEPLLSSSSKHDAAYEKFCSLVTKFQVAPNEATTVKLVQSFVSKSKPEQAITILENAAHHNVVLPLSHFKDVFSLFLSRKDYYNAAVVASDAVNYLYTNELVEKLLDTMVAHNQVPFALEILNEMIPETDFETVQQLFSPLVSLYKSKGLDVIGDHIFYAIDQLRISLIEFTEPAEQTSLPAPGADQPNVEIHDSDIFSKSLGIFSPELEQHVKE